MRKRPARRAAGRPRAMAVAISDTLARRVLWAAVGRLLAGGGFLALTAAAIRRLGG